MLQYKKMWMSQTEYLNDAQEVKHFIDIVENITGRIKSEEVPHNYYIGSFSEEGDLLSQWRAYCPAVGGFSIGIPANHLQQLVESKNKSLSPISRSSDDHEFGRRPKAKYQKMPSLYKLKNEFLFVKCIYDIEMQKQIAEELSGHNLEDIIKLCPIFKHPSFAEEKEWRIISPVNRIGPTPEDNSEGRLTAKFRDSPRGLTMYHEFDLDTKDLPLKEAMTADKKYTTITCGPTANKRGIKQAAFNLLSKCELYRKIGYEEYVKESVIPFKNW